MNPDWTKNLQNNLKYNIDNILLYIITVLYIGYNSQNTLGQFVRDSL